MKIITQNSVGEANVLTVAESAVPEPGPGEVRIRVAAAGINPVDAAVRSGAYPILGDPPFTLGWDLAGRVDAVGRGAEWPLGTRVFGMPRFPDEAAAYAEFAVAPADQVVEVPEGLGDADAAAVPLAGLTAYQALVHTAGLEAGKRALIVGASGGVGHLAVQVAKAIGARVVATARPPRLDFVRALGADEVIDYTGGSRLAGLEPVDVVLDPLGGEHTAALVGVVRPGGAVVSLVPAGDSAAAAAEAGDVRLLGMGVRPSGADLLALASWIAGGAVRPHVAREFPLAEAAEAHASLGSGVAGKLVLRP